MKGSRRMWARHATLLAITAFLLAGNLAFFFWYRSTMRDRRDALEARRADLDRQVRSVEEEATRLARQRDRLSQVSSAIDEFYRGSIGPPRETLAPLVEEIHGVLRASGISPTQIGYTTRSVPDLPLSEMLITFGFKSDYARFKQLLSSLQANRRWIVVRDVALSRDTDAPGAVQVRMALATYFSGEPGAAAPVPPVPRVSLPRGRPR